MSDNLAARRPLKVPLHPVGRFVVAFSAAPRMPSEPGFCDEHRLRRLWRRLHDPRGADRPVGVVARCSGGIQLRLLCNLMDGMLAVEGGLKSPVGDLYNEFPDRLSDAILLMSFGCTDASNLESVILGGTATAGALMTACVRMHGASLTGTHDFRGPMAKPQRMAVLTVACVLLAGAGLEGTMGSASRWAIRFMIGHDQTVPYVLFLITFLSAYTCWRRLRALAATLRTRSRP